MFSGVHEDSQPQNMPFKVASESFYSGVGGDSMDEEQKGQNSQHKRRLKSLLVKRDSPANSSVNIH